MADFKKDATLFSWTAAVLGRLSRFETDDEDPLPIGGSQFLLSLICFRGGQFRCSTMDKATKQLRYQEDTRRKHSIQRQRSILNVTWRVSFTGAVNDIGKVVEIEGPIDQSLAADSEGIIIRLRGDGNVYAAVCTRGYNSITNPLDCRSLQTTGRSFRHDL